MKGKKTKPFDPMFLSTNSLLNKKLSSKTSCHLVGITLVFNLERWNKRSSKLKEKKVKSIEFVIFK